MIKGFMIAGLGSFVEGGLRFIITNYSKHPNYFFIHLPFPQFSRRKAALCLGYSVIRFIHNS